VNSELSSSLVLTRVAPGIFATRVYPGFLPPSFNQNKTTSRAPIPFLDEHCLAVPPSLSLLSFLPSRRTSKTRKVPKVTENFTLESNRNGPHKANRTKVDRWKGSPKAARSKGWVGVEVIDENMADVSCTQPHASLPQLPVV
jgi:hypothetical protein